jgi:hypothetical protein
MIIIISSPPKTSYDLLGRVRRTPLLPDVPFRYFRYFERGL